MGRCLFFKRLLFYLLLLAKLLKWNKPPIKTQLFLINEL